MTSLEALKLSEPLEATYINLEHDLLVSIAKQLGSGKGINSATEWRIRMLAQLGAVSKQNIYFISGAAKTVPKELETAFMKSIDMTLDWLELDKDAQKSFMNDIFNGKAETSISSNMMNALKSYEKNAVVKLNQVNTVMKYKADSSYVNAVNNVFFKWTKLERIKQPELVNKQDYLNILNTKTAHGLSDRI